MLPTQNRTVASWPDAWLVQLLLDRGVLSPEDLNSLGRSRERSAWLACTRDDLATDQEILAAVSARYGLPLASLAGLDADAASLLKEDFARSRRVAPLRVNGRVLEAATWDAESVQLERDVAFASGRRVRLFLVSPSQLEELFERVYAGRIASADAEEAQAEGPAALDPDGPHARLVGVLIAQALRENSRDILLDPDPLGLTVRLRIDGELTDMQRWPLGLALPLIATLKAMAGLDPADRSRPQDGRAETQVGGRTVRLLVGTLPKGRTETAAIRIVDAGAAQRNCA